MVVPVLFYIYLEKYSTHLEHPLWREDILLVPQHCDVQALLVGKVVQLPLLVVDERAGVGQPKLLSISLGSADKTIYESVGYVSLIF